MPGWPTKLYRKTKHKTPRCQLYQPGFNDANACWLDGAWLTVPEDEWKARRVGHDKMYRAARKAMGKQHYRDDGVKPEDMDEAQRQAWEFCSGQISLDVFESGGTIGLAGADTAGNGFTEKSEKWLRETGYKIFRWVKKNGANGPEIVNQLKGLDVPKDLICRDRGRTRKDPVDTWQHIVDQNMENMEQHFEAMIEGAADEDSPHGESARRFFAQSAFYALVEQEEQIVRIEWDATRGVENGFTTHDREVARYVKMRRKAADGSESDEVFETWYGAVRESHNECARANLDNSDGRLFSYVLPKFNDDGTHEPWGERDVPWGQTEDVEGAAE